MADFSLQTDKFNVQKQKNVLKFSPDQEEFQRHPAAEQKTARFSIHIAGFRVNPAPGCEVQMSPLSFCCIFLFLNQDPDAEEVFCCKSASSLPAREQKE